MLNSLIFLDLNLKYVFSKISFTVPTKQPIIGTKFKT